VERKIFGSYSDRYSAFFFWGLVTVSHQEAAFRI